MPDDHDQSTSESEGHDYFSVGPDETVYAAIEKLAEKNVGSVLRHGWGNACRHLHRTGLCAERYLAYLERAASIRFSLAAVCLTVISSLSNNLRISSTAQATRAGSSLS